MIENLSEKEAKNLSENEWIKLIEQENKMQARKQPELILFGRTQKDLDRLQEKVVFKV